MDTRYWLRSNFFTPFIWKTCTPERTICGENVFENSPEQGLWNKSAPPIVTPAESNAHTADAFPQHTWLGSDCDHAGSPTIWLLQLALLAAAG